MKPPHSTIKLTPFRKLIIDGLDVGQKKHYIKGFIELDVTETRQVIRDYRRQMRQPLSFLAYFASAVTRALQANKSLNAGLKGDRVVVFDDIDLSVAVEMDLQGEKVPRLITIREAQNKSAKQIHQEIADAQKQNKQDGDVTQGETQNMRLVSLLQKLPKFFRMRLWNRLLRDPFFTKRMMGTVGITSVGMFGNVSGWPEPIPTSNHTVSIALGSITKKPRVVKGDIQIRDILHATILLDHDIVDGAPAARFVEQLRQLVERPNMEYIDKVDV